MLGTQPPFSELCRGSHPDLNLTTLEGSLILAARGPHCALPRKTNHMLIQLFPDYEADADPGNAE